MGRMTPPPSPSIEISVSDFARTHKGLITLLKAVAKAGPDGITTRKLYTKIKMTGHGDKLVDEAERKGYIVREERKPKTGVGFYPVYNIITPEGKALLKKLGQL